MDGYFVAYVGAPHVARTHTHARAHAHAVDAIFKAREFSHIFAQLFFIDTVETFHLNHGYDKRSNQSFVVGRLCD